MRLGTRLMLALAYVLVLAIVALEIPLAISLRERVDDEVRLQATNGARVTAAVAGPLVAKNDTDGLAQIAEEASRSTRGRVVIVDQSGMVLADSADGAAIGTDYSSRPEVAGALSDREVQFARESKTLDQHLLATSTPIESGGAVTGAVRVTQSIEAQSRAMNRAMVGLALIGLAVLAVGLAVGAYIARQIARPLRSFEAAARAVEEGDLSARAPVEGSLEQQSLAEAFNDMTERVSEMLASQERFVADASHQLRTPLAGLRLRIEEARARATTPELRDDLDHGLAEVDRLSRMVDELLVLTVAEEPGATGEIPVAEVVEDLVARWRNYPDAAGLQLVFEAGEAFAARIARGDLERVIEALLENALHYSPDGAVVRVRVSRGTVTIDDDGPGLGGEDPESLFTRFHRGASGRQRVEGTGLGLAIARETARRWDADVTLADRPEGGARASLVFARYSAAAVPANAGAQSAAPSVAQRQAGDE